MSHFAVAVFHRRDQDIDDLLAPYSENIKVVPYIRYTREQAIEYVRKNYLDYKDKTDDECWWALAKEYERPDDLGYDDFGNIYSTYNPKSKWDWYCIGGRWSGSIKTKSGRIVDEAYVKNIDFSRDEDEYRSALEFWKNYVDGNDPAHEHDSIYRKEYYKEYYLTAENYANTMANFSTRAVVTPDGEWHEVGEMGWFGTSYESPEESLDWHAHYKERFIDTAKKSWILTMVDCHI